MLSTIAFAQYNLPAGTRPPDDDQTTQQPATSSGPSAAQRAAAEDALAKQDYTAAQKILTQITTQFPTDARAQYDLGFAEDALDHTAAAETAYRKAIAADPKQFESHLGLGMLLARQNEDEAAIKELQAAVALKPASSDGSAINAAKSQAYRALARLEANAHPADALDSLLSALKLSPETPQDTLLAAELAEASGDNASAEAAYRRLLHADPNAQEPTSALAHLLVRQKKFADAQALLTDALKSAPDDPSLNAQLASVYGAEGKPEQAVPMLEKLHTAQPQDANISRMLADLYTQTGNAPKANALYASLLAQSPQDPSLLAARGDNLIRQQHFAEAESVLKRAVERASGFKNTSDLADAYSALAFASSENHDPSTTLEALSIRAKYLPETASTYFLWAAAHDLLHHNKQAVEYYQQFLSAAGGKFPDQEFEARHRIIALRNMR